MDLRINVGEFKPAGKLGAMWELKENVKKLRGN